MGLRGPRPPGVTCLPLPPPPTPISSRQEPPLQLHGSRLPCPSAGVCSAAGFCELKPQTGLLMDTWLSKRLFFGPTQTPCSLIRPCSTFSLAPAIPEPPCRLPGLSWSAPQGPGQAALLGPAGLAREAHSWLIPLAFSRRAGGKPEDRALRGELSARGAAGQTPPFQLS